MLWLGVIIDWGRGGGVGSIHNELMHEIGYRSRSTNKIVVILQKN